MHYKSYIEYTGSSNSCNSKKPEYHKPTRKRVIALGNKQRKLQNDWENPLKVAIEAKCVPNTNMPYARLPPSFPPSFMAKLNDLKIYESYLEKSEKDQEEFEINSLCLKYDEMVKKKISKNLFSNDNELYIAPKEVTPLNDYKLQNSKTKILEKLVTDADVKNLAEKRENYSTRNVDFMLKIWQKSENVNFELVSQKDKELESCMKAAAIRKSIQLAETSKHILQNQLVVNLYNKKAGIIMDENAGAAKKKKGAKSRLNSLIHAPTVTNESNSQDSQLEYYSNSYLSPSTMKVLKKFTKEGKSELMDQYGNLNENDMIKLILTGPNVADIPHYNLSSGSSTFHFQKSHKTDFKKKTYTPKALASLLTNENNIQQADTNDKNLNQKFRLVLPELSSKEDLRGSMINIDADVSFTKSSKVEYDPSLNSNESLEESDNQSMDYSMDSELKITEDSNENHDRFQTAKKELDCKESFSLNNFCALIADEYFSKQDDGDHNSEPFGITTIPNHIPKLSRLKDFLNGDFVSLQSTPEIETIARYHLVRAFSLALREDLAPKLKYEAAILLSKSGLFMDLSRWDLLLLKNIIIEILQNGNQSLKDEAVLCCYQINCINIEAIEHLITGLGDVEPERRKKLNAILTCLDLQHASDVVSLIIREAQNINFRVRLDVVHQLTTYVQRLGGVEEFKCKSKFPDSKTSSGNQTQNASLENVSKDIKKPPENEIINAAVDTLLKIMWEDWSSDVQDQASMALGNLGKGSAVFEKVITKLGSKDLVPKVQALKYLRRMAAITESTLEFYLKTFSDSYVMVRIEACKVACMLKSDHPDLIKALLDRLEDYDPIVRSYSIKALGLSKCKKPKNIECLNWAVVHDPHEAVRCEALLAFQMLGVISEDSSSKDSIISVLQTDVSEKVRKLAEKILTESLSHSNEPDLKIDFTNSGVASILTTNRVPFPHILSGKTPQEIEIFLRDSLIEEKEQNDVIEQVRALTKKDTIISQVAYYARHSAEIPKLQLDLEIYKDFRPHLKEIHGQKKFKGKNL